MVELLFEEFVKALKQLHEANPTIRIPLLLQSSIDNAKGQPNSDLNNVSTKQLITYLNQYREVLKAKSASKPTIQRKPTG